MKELNSNKKFEEWIRERTKQFLKELEEEQLHNR